MPREQLLRAESKMAEEIKWEDTWSGGHFEPIVEQATKLGEAILLYGAFRAAAAISHDPAVWVMAFIAGCAMGGRFGAIWGRYCFLPLRRLRKKVSGWRLVLAALGGIGIGLVFSFTTQEVGHVAVVIASAGGHHAQ